MDLAQRAELPFPASSPARAASPMQGVSSRAVTAASGDWCTWKPTLPGTEKEDWFSVDQQSFTSSFYNKEETGPETSVALLAQVSRGVAMKGSCSFLHAHNPSTANQGTFSQEFSLVEDSSVCSSSRLKVQSNWPKISPANDMVTTPALHSKERRFYHPVLEAWKFFRYLINIIIKMIEDY